MYDYKCKKDWLTPSVATVMWHNKFHEGMMLAGCNLSVGGQEIGAWMEEAGFINVNVIEMKLPIAPWPKEKRLKEAVRDPPLQSPSLSNVRVG